MHADHKDKYITFGSNGDVLENVVKCFKMWRTQPKKIVTNLVNLPVEDKCYSIFEYVLDHVAYKEDKAGYQFIKSPARLLDDGEGDCKSMTIFIASCLYCLGVPCKMRFVGFDNSGQYTHVYPVALDENGEEVIVDCVERDGNNLPVFDFAREYVRKIDIDCNRL